MEKVKKPLWKRILKVVLIVILCIVIFVAAFAVFMTVNEYNPADVESLEVKGQAASVLKAGEPVKVLTWNIGYGALGEGADFFMDGGERVYTDTEEGVWKNLQAIYNDIRSEDPDLVLLQEADMDSARSYNIDEPAYFEDYFEEYESVFALNYNTLFVPYPMPPMGKVVAGIQTLSSYDIADSSRYQLPCPFSWPVKLFNLKRCCTVTHIPIEGSDKQLALINLHLEAYDEGEGKIEQTKLLKSIMDREVSAGNYVIAGGDFNQIFSSYNNGRFDVTDPELWAPGIIEESDFGDGWKFVMDADTPSCRSLDRAYDPDDSGFQYYLIDGFIVSDNVAVWEAETLSKGFVNSDHNPVMIRVTLE